jgi:hypothetical protein
MATHQLLRRFWQRHRPQCFLNAAAIERCLRCACARQAAAAIGKQQNGIAVALPETAQKLVSSRR